MPRLEKTFPLLVTDDDVLAVEREIEEARGQLFPPQGGEPAEAGSAEDEVGALLDEGFFSEEDLCPSLGEPQPLPGEAVLAATVPAERMQEGGRRGADPAFPAGMAVAGLVPIVAYATNFAIGSEDFAWASAPAVVLAFYLALSFFGTAPRATVAFAATIHAVYLVRVTVDAFSPQGPSWNLPVAAAGWLILAAAAAWISVPLLGRLASGEAARPPDRLEPYL